MAEKRSYSNIQKLLENTDWRPYHKSIEESLVKTSEEQRLGLARSRALASQVVFI